MDDAVQLDRRNTISAVVDRALRLLREGARRGETPRVLPITREEFTAIMGGHDFYFGSEQIERRNHQFMGIPIAVGPVTYSWGEFPA